MTIQEFCRLFNVLPFSLLVVEKTKLECSLGLCLLVTFFKSDIQHFEQMLDGLTDVSALRVRLCELLVGFSCGSLLSVFDAKIKEVLPILD